MPDPLTLAIISDLHCRPSSTANGITRLCSDQARKPIEKHPVSALRRLIKEQSLTADVILCPGDITDKSDNQGFLSGWDYLKTIKKEFGAKHLFATLGNHDVNSRSKSSQSFAFAKDLDEDYPLGSNAQNMHFWAENYAIIEDKSDLYLIFNSSYSHKDTVNAKKCTINDSILESMRDKLKLLKKNYRFKIALCHHHPINHYNRDHPDTDLMNNGDQFIKLLNDFSFELLVHGHKHDPRLTIYNSLPILAAGSFSALANLNDVGAENMFHLITLEGGKKGVIKSFVYNPIEGWTLSSGTKFPNTTGFGFSGEIETLATRCNDWYLNTGKAVVSYNELILGISDLKYLPPDIQKKFHLLMIEHYKLEFSPALYREPKHLLKQYE